MFKNTLLIAFWQKDVPSVSTAWCFSFDLPSHSTSITTYTTPSSPYLLLNLMACATTFILTLECQK